MAGLTNAIAAKQTLTAGIRRSAPASTADADLVSNQMILKKLLVIVVVAAVVLFLGAISIGAGNIISLDVFFEPRGGMMEFAGLSFCVGLVGVYWLIRVRIPKVIAQRKKEEKSQLDE